MTETVELERPLRCLGPTRAAGVSQRRAGGGSGARFAEGVNGTACGLSAVPDVGADGVSTPGRTGPSEVARAAGVAASEAARGRGQKDLVVLPARPRLCWSASHSVSRGFLGTPVAASRPLASRLLRGGRFVRRRFERSVCSAAGAASTSGGWVALAEGKGTVEGALLPGDTDVARGAADSEPEGGRGWTSSREGDGGRRPASLTVSSLSSSSRIGNCGPPTFAERRRVSQLGERLVAAGVANLCPPRCQPLLILQHQLYIRLSKP